jgi:hypothetical protein
MIKAVNIQLQETPLNVAGNKARVPFTVTGGPLQGVLLVSATAFRREVDAGPLQVNVLIDTTLKAVLTRTANGKAYHHAFLTAGRNVDLPNGPHTLEFQAIVGEIDTNDVFEAFVLSDNFTGTTEVGAPG